MTTINISEIADWSQPKRVQTKYGPRDLRSATPEDRFWEVWRSAKQSLKDAGVSCGKSNGSWEALWWQPIPEDEQEQLEAAQDASRATDADVDVPSPDGLEFYPYQRAGIAYALERKNVLIGDEMGLGKSPMSIGIWNSDSSMKRMLIVCPASLRLNWKREFERWSVRKVRVEVINGGKPDAWPVNAESVGVLIVNYDVLHRHKHRILQLDWDLLVADEIHLCKNPSTQRTKALLGYRPRKGQEAKAEMAIPAKRRVFLSGSPMVNRPVELWPIVQALDPRGLGASFFPFVKRYCAAHQTRWGWDFTGASNLDQLQILLRERFMVRRLKKDVLTELPAKTRQVIELPANGAARAVAAERTVWEGHQAYIADLEARLREAEAAEMADMCEALGIEEADEIRRELAAAKRTAFTEMAKVRHETALAKVPKVVEHVLSALEEGPVILFAHHRDVIEQIKQGIEDDKDTSHRVVKLTGDTSMTDRQQAVDDFQNGEADLFIGNIQAAGVGITLTRSSRVIFAELDWVPGNLSQAEDRAHRIGQSDNVLVQHLVLEDSVDAEMVVKVIQKQAVIDAALDDVVERDYGEQKSDEIEYEAKVDKLQQAGDSMTEQQIAAVHEGLRRLAGVCDGAAKKDDMGFNGADSRFGKALAVQPELTRRQAAIGLRMITKYRRQLGAELVATAKGE